MCPSARPTDTRWDYVFCVPQKISRSPSNRRTRRTFRSIRFTFPPLTESHSGQRGSYDTSHRFGNRNWSCVSEPAKPASGTSEEKFVDRREVAPTGWGPCVPQCRPSEEHEFGGLLKCTRD